MRTRSRLAPWNEGGDFSARFSVEHEIVVHDLFKFGGSIAQRVGVAEHQVAARLQTVIKAANQLLTLLVGKINQDVHAKDTIHASEIKALHQVHHYKRNFAADARLYFVLRARGIEAGVYLLRCQVEDAAGRVDRLSGAGN